MRKSTILSILSGLSAILFLTNSSCNPDPDENGPTLTVRPEAITLEADGTGQAISVSSNTSWTVRADDSWLKYSPTGGTGESSITVSASYNTGEERYTKLTLTDKTGRVTAEVSVTQKKAESTTPTPNPDQKLTVNPSNLNFNSSAGSNTFTIESNTSWTIKCDQAWCTVNTVSGSSNATVTVNVTENTSTSSAPSSARYAIITVSNSSASSTILVSQEAMEQEVISDLISIMKSGKSISVEIKGIYFEMIKVEGGTFTMGATGATAEQEIGDADDKPAHSVTLSDYYIGETEVTQELWETVMGEKPSEVKTARNPVETVSWNDCQTFITELNALTGETGFRLPTEAEWEFAARGGNKSKGYIYAGSDNLDRVAWHGDNSGKIAHNVGQKSPNELELYDMSGNVWEWCADRYGSYEAGAQSNPVGPSYGSDRVMRGGSWTLPFIEWNYRVSTRESKSPDYRSNNIGLRLAYSSFLQE